MGFHWEQFGSSWLYYVQLAFTIGMLVHAYRSGAEAFWYWIIILVPGIGSWVYFFAVFLRGFHFRRVTSSEPLWQRKLALDELRYRAERTPTVTNRMALGQRLMEKNLHTEAVPLFEAVLQMDQNYCQAMHDLALCKLACNEPKQAVTLLKRLLERDYRWSYYRAWRTLIDAHLACQDPEESLKACRELEKMVPTLENKCLLAEHLLDFNLKSEAAHLMDQALEDHAYAPFGKRVKNWRLARHAQQLLKEAEAP